MDLPVIPPLTPMLAKSSRSVAAAVKAAGELSFEPKWDGFRALIFRDGDELEIFSRSGKPLAKYFPELREPILAQLPTKCVVDGEIVIAIDDRLHFDSLTARIHPAASRIAQLAEETPAQLVVFDLLALDQSLIDEPFHVRRDALVASLARVTSPISVTQVTSDSNEAQSWYEQFEGAGLDGVIGKAIDSPYVPGGRTMIKIKHARTADVVVAGYRLHKTSTAENPLLGSLLLGLFDASGNLQHVGSCASFTASRRAELVSELAPLTAGSEEHPWLDESPDPAGRVPGARNRWNSGKDLSFVRLRPERVAEVGYEHMEGAGDNARFRHTAQFKRWRDDREAASCTYAQLEEVASYKLSDVLLP